MATSTAQKATERVVVLLRPSEKQRIQRLARKAHVSSAEIVRRSLAAYNEAVPEIDDKSLSEMNAVLDRMLANIQSTRLHVRQNLAQIEEMKASRK